MKGGDLEMRNYMLGLVMLSLLTAATTFGVAYSVSSHFQARAQTPTTQMDTTTDSDGDGVPDYMDTNTTGTGGTTTTTDDTVPSGTPQTGFGTL